MGMAYLAVDPHVRGRMKAKRSYVDSQMLDRAMGEAR